MRTKKGFFTSKRRSKNRQSKIFDSNFLIKYYYNIDGYHYNTWFPTFQTYVPFIKHRVTQKNEFNSLKCTKLPRVSFIIHLDNFLVRGLFTLISFKTSKSLNTFEINGTELSSHLVNFSYLHSYPNSTVHFSHNSNSNNNNKPTHFVKSISPWNTTWNH